MIMPTIQMLAKDGQEHWDWIQEQKEKQVRPEECYQDNIEVHSMN